MKKSSKLNCNLRERATSVVHTDTRLLIGQREKKTRNVRMWSGNSPST